MTIGPDFVFIAVPRTASHSVSKWLENFGGREDEANYYHRADVPEEHKDKFTFTIVRDPYTRWLAVYHMVRGQEPWKSMDSADFVRWVMDKSEHIGDPERFNWDTWYWPQYELLNHARLDKIVRYEDLGEVNMLPFVKQFHALPYINPDPCPLYGMTPEFIRLVNQVSRDSFERFGYAMIPDGI